MTYDMGFGDSDDDDFSMNGDHADLNVDYWFGKKYFECVIAQHLLHSEAFTGDMAMIDASWPCPSVTFMLTNQASMDNYAAFVSISAGAATTLWHER